MNSKCEGNKCGTKCEKNIRERRADQEMSCKDPITCGHIQGDHQREQPDKAPLVDMPQQQGGQKDDQHLYHHTE